MLESYWPTEVEINHCIRTEAEELAEYVLLAVHEPMVLTRRIAGETTGERKTEDDLLRHLLTNERPIPIIGESGTGKSHLVRWLDSKLRVHAESAEWHIRRIPKNASLGQVLEILLEGLSGEEFETARKKIRDVGERLNVREVADHLIVFMSHRLDELWNNTKVEISEYKSSGQQPDDETKIRIDRINRHAKRDALPALLGDTHYKKKLVEKGKCLYQIAQRLAKGSSDEELATSDYQIKVEDLDFELNLGDLSREAGIYVNKASLNTMPERRQEAADLLNEVLNEACRKAFQHLFHFHGGSFQDLFTDIRRYLKLQNKTMVVLVEDMAAISAIEDVLIDSLMQEGIRDGVEELCPLRSAIAVTDGYAGYVRRRNTLATRARYEWYIDKYLRNPEETYDRIEDFCGRYMNAARHGKKALESSYDPLQINMNWPTVWHSSDADEKELVEAFGVSTSGFPLFPYNSASLKALADRYCQPNRILEFNPRKILGHILIDILANYRPKFCNQEFPSVDFEEEITCPATLAMQIDNSVYDNVPRAQKIAAIWGYGAEDIKHLAGIMSPVIARVFAAEEFFNILEGTVAIKPPVDIDPPVVGKSDIGGNGKGSGTDKKAPEVDHIRQIPKDVDGWFKDESIPQNVANDIRVALAEHIQDYWLNNYRKWVGMRELPSLKRGRLTLIEIPFNPNNPVKTYASIGTEKEFKKSPLKYKTFIIALLRKKVMNGWGYDDGYQDYCFYSNFINKWVPNVILSIAEEKRQEIREPIAKHISATYALEPGIGQFSLKDKISFLCISDILLKKKYEPTGLEVWDIHRDEIIGKWQGMQDDWLWTYAINNHALEGDLLLSAFRSTGENTIPPSTSKAAQSARSQLLIQYPAFELLDWCSNREEFSDTLNSLLILIESLSSEAEYKDMEEELTAKKYINRIKTVMDGDYWTSTKAMVSIREPFEGKSAIRSLNVFDSHMANDVDLLLTTWNKLYKINKPRMEAENQSQGSGKRQNIRKNIDLIISDIQEVIEKLKSLSS